MNAPKLPLVCVLLHAVTSPSDTIQIHLYTGYQLYFQLHLKRYSLFPADVPTNYVS